MREAVVNGEATDDTASVHNKLRAVGERVFCRIRIEILVHVGDAFGTLAVMAATQRLGFDRPGVLHPAEVIDMVDVKVAVASAARPKEAVEVLNLPKQFAHAGGLRHRRERPDWPMHPVTAQENEVADFT